MWHLILPPFVIIFGIGILLWFFSRRMDDPSFLSRVGSARGEASAVSRSRSLSRKAFFLKLLEKMASKFKTNSLRIHNFFQHFLVRLRQKRKALDEMRREAKEMMPALAQKSLDGKRRWFGMRKKEEIAIPEPAPVEDVVPSEAAAKEVTREIEPAREPISQTIPEERAPSSAFGIFGRKRRVVDTAAKHADVTPIPVETPASEPILKKEMVHPERPKIRVAEKDPREERLIDRIAENPRDAASYEELGDLYLAARNMQDAKACYRQVLKLHPTNRAVKLKIRKVERFFEENVS